MAKSAVITGIEEMSLWPQIEMDSIQKSHTVQTVFLGRCQEGRDRQMLSYAIELLKDKNEKVGATFVVETPRLGATLYNVAKGLKRKVIWLNHQLNLGVRNQLMWMDEYNEDLLDRWVINYDKAIRLGYVVIIDLEPNTYYHRYDFAVTLLLWHLRQKIDQIYSTERRAHALFVENTKRHFEDLKFFLEFGPFYDLSNYLWLESMSQLKDSVERIAFLETTIDRFVLNARFAISDLPYYEKLFSDIPAVLMSDVLSPVAFYRVITKNVLYQGYYHPVLLAEEEFKRYRNNAKKGMTALINDSVKEEEQQTLYLESLDKTDEASTLKVLSQLDKDVIPKHENEKPLAALRGEALARTDRRRMIEVDKWEDVEF